MIPQRLNALMFQARDDIITFDQFIEPLKNHDSSLGRFFYEAGNLKGLKLANIGLSRYL